MLKPRKYQMSREVISVENDDKVFSLIKMARYRLVLLHGDFDTVSVAMNAYQVKDLAEAMYYKEDKRFYFDGVEFRVLFVQSQLVFHTNDGNCALDFTFSPKKSDKIVGKWLKWLAAFLCIVKKQHKF